MRSASLAVAGLLLLAAAPARTQDPAAEIRRQIDRLGADAFADREAAQDALLRAGPPARLLLEEALRTTADPEVRQRAGTVLRWLELGFDADALSEFGPLLKDFDTLSPAERIGRIREIAGRRNRGPEAVQVIVGILRRETAPEVRKVSVDLLDGLPDVPLVGRFRADPSILRFAPEITPRLARALVRTGQPADAVPLFETAFLRQPKDRSLGLELAKALQALDRHAEAVEHLLALLSLRADTPGNKAPSPRDFDELLYPLQESLDRTKSPPPAAAILDRMDPRAILRYADHLRGRKRRAEALEACRAAAARRPRDRTIRKAAGEEYALNQMPAEAVPHLVAALAAPAGPDEAPLEAREARAAFVQLYQCLDQTKTGPAERSELLARTDRAYLVPRAEALMELERAEEAATHFLEAVGKQPNDRRLRLNTAEALTRAGRAAEALPHFQAGFAPAAPGEELTVGPYSREPAMPSFLDCLERTGRTGEAPALLTGMDPAYVPAYAHEAAEREKPFDALPVLLAFVDRRPEDWLLRWETARALIKTVRPAEAVPHVVHILTHKRTDIGESNFSTAAETVTDLFRALVPPAPERNQREAFLRIADAVRESRDFRATRALIHGGLTVGLSAETEAFATAANEAHFRGLAGSKTSSAAPDDALREALETAAGGNIGGALARLTAAANSLPDASDPPPIELQRLLLAAEIRRRDVATDALAEWLSRPNITSEEVEIAAFALDRYEFDDLRDRCLDRLPDDPRIRLFRAAVTVRRGDLSAAEVTWRGLLGGPETDAAREWLNALARMRGEMAGPRDYGPEPPANDPEEAGRRARWLATRKRNDEAEAAAVAALESDETRSWQKAFALEAVLDIQGRERMFALLRVIEHRWPATFKEVLKYLFEDLRKRPDAEALTSLLVSRTERHLAEFDPFERGRIHATVGDFAAAVRDFAGRRPGKDSNDEEAFRSRWATGDLPGALAGRALRHFGSTHGSIRWTLNLGWEEEHRRFIGNLPDPASTARGALRVADRIETSGFDKGHQPCAELAELAGLPQSAVALWRTDEKPWTAAPFVVRALIRQGRPGDARTFLESQDHWTAAGWRVLAAELAQAGDPAGSHQAKQRADAAGAGSKEECFRSGQWLVAHGFPRQARPEFEKALRVAKREDISENIGPAESWEYAETNTCEYLAQIRADEGQYAEAQRLLHRALDMLPRNGLSITEPGGEARYQAQVLAFWPARIRLTEGKTDDARKLLEAGLRLDPEFDEAWDLWLPLLEGDARKAAAERRREQLARRVRRFPLDPDALRGLGDLCLREGLDPATAREAVERALKIAPALAPKLGDLAKRLGL